jgi:soluble lytic murein transglycosylase
MGGATLWEVGVSEPAGRREAASRRQTLALALAMMVGAGASGAVLGLLRQPDSDRAREQSLAAAAAALESAREAQASAAKAEEKLASVQTQMDALRKIGADQELSDFQEAEQLGVSRLMGSSLWGDDRRRVEAAIVRESRRNGLDPLLVTAVIQVESRFDPFAVSGVGARGLMQLMPPTAQFLHGKPQGKFKAAHLFDPVLNVELGTAYLAQLMNRFDGDLNIALIAYNAGPGAARSLTPKSRSYKRLSAYPRLVLTAYKALLLPQDEVASQ